MSSSVLGSTTEPPQAHINRLMQSDLSKEALALEAKRSSALVEAFLTGGRFFSELLQNVDDAKGTKTIVSIASKKCVEKKQTSEKLAGYWMVFEGNFTKWKFLVVKLLLYDF